MIRVNSKAQISIFVIVSAILVLGLISLMAFNYERVPFFADQTSSGQVKTYVESCLVLTSREGINRIGASGGWLYHPPGIFTDRNMPQEYNKRAIGLNFLETVTIPYWYYFDDSAQRFVYNIPEYDSSNEYSLRSQLQRYVSENLEDCIESFVAFDNIYNINYDQELTQVQVTFRQDDIDVALFMPLQIESVNSNSTEFVQNFNSRVENRLLVPYSLARDITIAQGESSFIEHRILNFLAPYQTSNQRDLLPPFYDFRMTYDFRPWNLNDVESLIKQIVNTHISKIQDINTNYHRTEVDQRLRNNEFAISLTNLYTKDYISEHSQIKQSNPSLFRRYSDYELRPYYETFFPSSVKIFPGMGGQVLLPRPQAIMGLIPFFFTEYVAVYEMTLPVIFEIKPARSNDNFVFNLAIEANIDYNKPLRENSQLQINVNPDDSLLNNALVCDPPHFISDFVYLNITDPINHGNRGPNDPRVGVEDAIVSFTCKGIATCYVTNTEINGRYSQESITELRFRLPINCDPGTLEVYKFGHKKLTFDNLNPSLSSPINLGEQYMPSRKELDVEITVIPTTASRFAQGRELTSSEKGFIIFQNLNDRDIVEVMEINSNNQYSLTIDLMPGNYSVEGYLIHEDPITIPSKRFCYRTGVFSGQDCETLPEIELESWVRGGIEIEQVEFTIGQVLNSNKITINLVDAGLPESYDSLTEVSEKITNLKLHSTGKAPYLNQREN